MALAAPSSLRRLPTTPPQAPSPPCASRLRSRPLREPRLCQRLVAAVAAAAAATAPLASSPTTVRTPRASPLLSKTRHLLMLWSRRRTRSGGSTSCCARFRKRGADSRRGPTNALPSRRPSYVRGLIGRRLTNCTLATAAAFVTLCWVWLILCVMCRWPWRSAVLGRERR